MSYLAIFLTPELNLIGSKKFKATDTFLNYKKGTFNIRLEAYLYKSKDSIIYAYIYPTDERVLIDVAFVEPIKQFNKDREKDVVTLDSARLVKIKEKIEHGDLHLIVAESIIGQLARAFLGTVKTNWVLIILALAAGIGIGYVLGSSLGHQAATTIYNNATSLATPIPKV
jgi:hypothetical protein